MHWCGWLWADKESVVIIRLKDKKQEIYLEFMGAVSKDNWYADAGGTAYLEISEMCWYWLF